MRGKVIQVLDDLDKETPGAKPVRFGLDGKEYEIDLTPANEAELRKMLGRYVSEARMVGRPARSIDYVPPHDPETVRRWAALRGIPHPRRGFPGKELVERFNVEHSAAV